MRRLGMAAAAILLSNTGLNGTPRASDAQDLRALDTADAMRGWEAIGRLDSSVSFCSATLIAPDVVLTAAHCLYDQDGNRLADSDLTFSASYRNGRAEAYRGVRQSVQPDAYPGPRGGTGSEIIGHDIAILHLDRPIPTQTVTPLSLGDQGRVRDMVTVVSYGEDREAVASIEEDCRILAQDGRVDVLSCSVVSGSSGAPILRVQDGRVEVISVVSARAEWNGGPVSVAVAANTLVPELLALGARSATTAERMPEGVRRLTVGDGNRSGLGARFVRP